jgi:hypothetical protein
VDPEEKAKRHEVVVRSATFPIELRAWERISLRWGGSRTADPCTSPIPSSWCTILGCWNVGSREAGPSECHPCWTLHRRRRSGALYRSARHRPRGQGRADRCRSAAHAENSVESRRSADRGVRPDPRRCSRRSIAVLQRSDDAVLWCQPHRRQRLAWGAGLVLDAAHAGRAQECARLHQGLLRDRLHKDLEKFDVFDAEATRAWGPRGPGGKSWVAARLPAA